MDGYEQVARRLNQTGLYVFLLGLRGPLRWQRSVCSLCPLTPLLVCREPSQRPVFIWKTSEEEDRCCYF